MPTTAPTYVRYRVVAVTTLMAVLLYLDRFCISFAEVYIKEDLGLTDTQVGWMLSAFFWTYALGQVPSGWLTDRFGARIMLTAYILLWSLFTGLTGAAGIFVALLLLRFGFGIGQAGAYPTSANLVSKWVPFTGRGTASSIIAFGGRIGGALAPLLTALLIVQFVPVSTSSLITRKDVLDAPRLCYEVTYGKDTSKPISEIREKDQAAQIGAKVVSRMPAKVQKIVTEIADEYASTVEQERRKAKAEGKPADQLNPEVAPPSDPAFNTLSGSLSAVIRLNDLFQREDAKGLSLSREGKKLLAMEPANRTQQQTERLNRLILETIYPESIKKVYGAGWRYVMMAYGLVGLIVALLFWLVSRDRPASHPRCNEAERKLIERDRPSDATKPDGKVGAVPMAGLLTSRSMWLNCLMQWCTNVGWVFLVIWLPRYLDTVHHVPVEQRGVMASIPLLVGWAGMLFGGALTDFMVRIVGLRWGRALPMSMSRFIAMSAYIVCLFEPSPWVAVVAFSVVAFSTDLGTGAVWAFMQDVGGRYVGSVLGWGNMWGNLGAAVTPPLLIWIVVKSPEWNLPAALIWIVGEGPNQNWNLAFLTCATAFLISGLAAIGVDATKPIAREDPDDESPTKPT